MRRILVLFLLLAGALSATAEEKEPRKAYAVLPPVGVFEAALSISGFPGVQANSLGDGMHQIDPVVSGTDLWRAYDGFYEKTYTTGTFLLDLDWNLSRFFAVGARAGYNQFWGTHTTKGRFHAEQIALLPHVKYTLVRRPVFHLYLRGAAGAGYYPGFDRLENPVQFEYQLNVGAAFGKKFYGRVEAGFGTLFFGVALGAGYRF